MTDTQGCIDVAGMETSKLEEGHERAGMTEEQVVEALDLMADGLEDNSALLVFSFKKPEEGENALRQTVAKNRHFGLAPEVGRRIDQIINRNQVPHACVHV